MFQECCRNVSSKLMKTKVSWAMFQKSCRNVSSATFVHKSFMQMFQKRFTNVSTKLSFSNVSIEMFQKCVSHVSTKLFKNYKLHGKCFRPVSETFITKLLKDGHFHISTTVRKCFWHFYWNVSKFQNTRGRNVSDTFRAMWVRLQNWLCLKMTPTPQKRLYLQEMTPPPKVSPFLKMTGPSYYYF